MPDVSRRDFAIGAAAIGIASAGRIQQSVAETPNVLRASFERLWSSHPIKGKGLGNTLPCRNLGGTCYKGETNLRHQCTIRMGECFKIAFPGILYCKLPRIETEDRQAPDLCESRKPQDNSSPIRTCGLITLGGCKVHSPNDLHTINAREFQRLIDAMIAPANPGYHTLIGFKPGEYLGSAKGFRKQLKGQRGLIFFEDCYDGHGEFGGSHFDLWDGEKVKNEVYDGEPDSAFDKTKEIKFWKYNGA